MTRNPHGGARCPPERGRTSGCVGFVFAPIIIFILSLAVFNVNDDRRFRGTWTLMLEGGFHTYGSMTGRKNNMRSGIVLVYPTTPSTVAVKTDPGTVNQTPEGKLEEACTP